ncbi:uncharacterized protein V2V93DRAFT_376053 [Kockiozyma suomiensis]|uniref:uncharacterized protein n=1 Tax=Kockiozyma suomiensis TaxID=1337062 RepID=UPI0033441CF5
MSDPNPSVLDLDALYDPSSGSFIGFNGLPTLSQCTALVDAYVETLSDVKKSKSLISRKMYDDILAVLIDEDLTTVGSAQFRFWARSNFALFRDSDSQRLHIMHKAKPVAVKEELYGVLALCHLAASHGGRDKTLAQLRAWYTRVPKNLIAQYIKLCPTCSPSAVSLDQRPELVAGSQCYRSAAAISDCRCAHDIDGACMGGEYQKFAFRRSVVKYRIQATVRKPTLRAECAARQAGHSKCEVTEADRCLTLSCQQPSGKQPIVKKKRTNQKDETIVSAIPKRVPTPSLPLSVQKTFQGLPLSAPKTQSIKRYAPVTKKLNLSESESKTASDHDSISSVMSTGTEYGYAVNKSSVVFWPLSFDDQIVKEEQVDDDQFQRSDAGLTNEVSLIMAERAVVIAMESNFFANLTKEDDDPDEHIAVQEKPLKLDDPDDRERAVLLGIVTNETNKRTRPEDVCGPNAKRKMRSNFELCSSLQGYTSVDIDTQLTPEDYSTD